MYVCMYVVCMYECMCVWMYVSKCARMRVLEWVGGWVGGWVRGCVANWLAVRQTNKQTNKQRNRETKTKRGINKCSWSFVPINPNFKQLFPPLKGKRKQSGRMRWASGYNLARWNSLEQILPSNISQSSRHKSWGRGSLGFMHGGNTWWQSALFTSSPQPKEV